MIVRALKYVFKFFIVTLTMLIFCMTAWGVFVCGPIYQSDGLGGFDFLGPGYWVDFKYGDTLSPGWTLHGLWVIWWNFVVVATAIGVFLIWLPWRRTIAAAIDRFSKRFPRLLPP